MSNLITDQSTLTYNSSSAVPLSFHVHSQVGYWEVVPSVRFGITKMPNKFHQFIMKMVFAWKFVAVSEKTTNTQLLKG